MPFSNVKVVLSRQAMGDRASTIRAAARRIFPNVMLEEREGICSSSLVVDVLTLGIVENGESAYISKGVGIVAEFERRLQVAVNS